MKTFVTACLSILVLNVTPLLAQKSDVLLYQTDFSRLSPGKFGEYTTPAFPEYHYAPREFMDGWDIVNNRGPEEWKVFERDGEYTLEFLGYNREVWTYEFTYPILATGDSLWRDYNLEAEVTPINREDLNGIIFRYQDGRHYYLLAFGPDDTISLRYRDGEKAFRSDGWTILASTKRPTDRSRTYTMRVEATGPRLRCSLDGELLFEVDDDHYDHGQIGLFATTPVRFHSVSVTTTAESRDRYLAQSRARRTEIDQLRADNPQPVVWKRIATPGFGAARALRLGDLDGDGQLDILIVQNVPFFGGNYNQISCLTALTLEGRVLWQKGRPDPDHAWVSYDVAAQIHDIDDDGDQEVIYAVADEIRILDGKTGEVEATHPVPSSEILPGEVSWNEYKHYYRRDHLPYLSVDSIAFGDLRGTGKPLDVIIKDRHTRLWAFTNEFEPLWTSSANLGHYPYFYDSDKDGRDEIFLGYTLFDDDGKQLWSLDDQLQEHSDGTCAGDFSLEGKPDQVLIAGSDDGVILLDLDGNLIKHHRVGHAQTPTVGQYRPDVSGLEFCIINYWGEPGMITLYDHGGNEITRFELIHSGSPVLPVNWRGDGQEFILLSANVREGGMVDGWGRRVVMFPEDGHPDMAYIVQDFTGDSRDEIMVWDTDGIWIYTQSEEFKGDQIYAPTRPPLYNESNYLPFVSWPAWQPHGQ
jgi:hypothetical protein